MSLVIFVIFIISLNIVSYLNSHYFTIIYCYIYVVNQSFQNNVHCTVHLLCTYSYVLNTIHL